jgi:hypothetical protein
LQLKKKIYLLHLDIPTQRKLSFKFLMSHTSNANFSI